MTDKLKTDHDSEMPSEQEVIQMWKDITITELTDWSKSAEVLVEKITETHINGGIQLHKYKISENACFQWFASRKKLNDIAFFKTFFCRPELSGYREDLETTTPEPKYSEDKWYYNAPDITKIIAKSLTYGGALSNGIAANEAQEIAMNFVSDVFDNRLDEIEGTSFYLHACEWRYFGPWGFTLLLFDKRKSVVVIVDVTDTD